MQAPEVEFVVHWNRPVVGVHHINLSLGPKKAGRSSPSQWTGFFLGVYLNRSFFTSRLLWSGRSLLIELESRFCQLALALQVEPFELRLVAFLHVGIFTEYACHSDVSFGSV
jgi:hypothetical protein